MNIFVLYIRMHSVTTLTLFRFPSLLKKIWAFGQMQFAHASLSKTAGLHFYKLLGSGRDLGFNPLPDWGVYGLLCVWDNEKAAEDFFSHSKIFQRYVSKTNEQWTVYMKPIQTKGMWSGGNPFTPSTDLDATNPLIAVITRATIKLHKLGIFWKFVPISQRPIQQGCPVLIYTKGIGEAPLIQMATFSLWENATALKNFAYNSPEHREAITKTHQINWYHEEMFTRFQPYRSIGKWEGQNILETYLKH